VAGQAAENKGELVLAPPKDDKWVSAWRMTEALVRMMRDEVEQKGGRFILFMASSGPQENGDPATRARLQEKLGVPDLFYPEHHMTEAAQRDHVEIVTVAEQLQRWAETNKKPTHGFPNAQLGAGHWNVDGHRVVTDLLTAHLCAKRAQN
jgi:hypothetical protein